MDVKGLLPPRAGIRHLPHSARPRLYLAGSTPWRRWQESALYPAFRRTARLYRVFLRCKAALAFRAVTTTSAHIWAVREFVGDLIPSLCSSAILVGTPGPAQKMIIQLWDENGVVGYLKYAEKPAARKRLEGECHVLAALPDSLGPAVIKYGEIADGTGLLLSPIAGRPLAPKLPPKQSVIDFLQPRASSELASIENHPWTRMIRERYPSMDRCLDDLNGRKWRITIHHGDAAPWNILRTSDDALRAIDWEYGAAKGFPYLDLAHYVLQVSLLIHRCSPEEARKRAVHFVCRNSSPALGAIEGEAVVRLAAFHAYMQLQEDGHPGDAVFQTWRRWVWERRQ
jgi:hypothetical protein